MENLTNIATTPASTGETSVTPPVVDPKALGNTETPVDTASDPNESFSDWLARQKTEGKEKVSSKKEPVVTGAPDVVGKESLATKDLLKGDTKPAPETETLKPLSLKVGDKEYTTTDIEKLSKDHGAANENYQKQVTENQKMIKDVEAFVDTLRKDPGAILERFKITQDQVEKYLWDKYYRFKNETPAQKAERLEGELKARDTKDAQTQQQQQADQQREANRQYWQQKVKEGLGAEGLPENDWTVQRMAGYIQQMQQKGLNIPMNELAKYVKNDYNSAQQELLKNMSPEQVAQALGKDTMDTIRKKDVEKFKQDKFQNTNPGQGTVKRDLPKDTKKKVYKSPYDLLDDL